jgi:hypothetical protein
MVIFNRGKFLAIWRGFSSPPQFKLFPRNVDQSYGFTIVRQFPLLVVALFTFISGDTCWPCTSARERQMVNKN